MTTYWTVLAITFIVNGEMMTSKLLFPTMKSCGAAMNVLYYDHVQTHFKESMAQCVKSTLVSNKLTKMPRPKPRPVWLEKDTIILVINIKRRFNDIRVVFIKEIKDDGSY
jgi:hypothetical protein